MAVDQTTNHRTDSAEEILDALLEEIAGRLRRGENVDVEECAARHPEHAERLRRVVQGLQAVIDLGHSIAEDGPAETAHENPAGMVGRLGDFRILREIGRGGMGVVYEAEQTSLGRRVALKVLPMAAALDSRQLQRFQLEAQAAACLHHTNIVPVFAVGAERGVPYYAMQFIEGCSLAQLLAELRRIEGHEPADNPTRRLPDLTTSTLAASLLAGEGRSKGSGSGSDPDAWTAEFRTDRVPASSEHAGTPGTPPPSGRGEVVRVPSTGSSTRDRAYIRNVARLGLEAAEALDHAHARGILHRDIKPGNLLVDADGRLWVTDFGLAQIQGDHRLTLTGDVLGTLRYMSPEQALGKRVVIDGRTDVYSLGVTLYELLTLRPALDGRDRAEILRRLAAEEPTPLPKLNPAVPRDLATIVNKAMAREPHERYATAKDLADDLQRFLLDRPILARPPSLLDRAVKWSRRHTAAVAATMAVLMLAVVLAVVGLVLVSRERNKAEQRLALARRAVDEMYTEVAEDWLAKQPAMTSLQRRFLEKALGYYEQFAREQGEDPAVRFDAARARMRVGRIQQSLGNFERAEAENRASIVELDALSSRYPDRPEYRRELSQGLKQSSFLSFELGHFEEAQPMLERAAGVLSGLLERWPDDPELRADLAGVLRSLGVVSAELDAAKAEPHLVRSRDLLDRLLAETPGDLPLGSELARSEKALADLYHRTKRLVEADRIHLGTIARLEALVAADPQDPDHRSRLATSLMSRANVLDDMGRPEEAIEVYGRSKRTLEDLVRDFPDHRSYRGHLLLCIFNLVQVVVDKPARYEEVIREGVALAEALVRDHPAVPEYRIDLCQLLLAQAMRDREHEQARAALERAYQTMNRLVEDFPDRAEYRRYLAITSAFIAANFVSGPPGDPLFEPALGLERARRAVEMAPDDPDLRSVLGRALYRAGDAKEAVGTIERANMDGPSDRFDDFFLAMAHERLGDHERAIQAFRRADDWLQNHAPTRADSDDYPDPAAQRRIREEAAEMLGLVKPTPGIGEPSQTSPESLSPEATDAGPM